MGKGWTKRREKLATKYRGLVCWLSLKNCERRQKEFQESVLCLSWIQLWPRGSPYCSFPLQTFSFSSWVTQGNSKVRDRNVNALYLLPPIDRQTGCLFFANFTQCANHSTEYISGRTVQQNRVPTTIPIQFCAEARNATRLLQQSYCGHDTIQVEVFRSSHTLVKGGLRKGYYISCIVGGAWFTHLPRGKKTTADIYTRRLNGKN